MPNADGIGRSVDRENELEENIDDDEGAWGKLSKKDVADLLSHAGNSNRFMNHDVSRVDKGVIF